MSDGRLTYGTAPIEPSDAILGFACGVRPLDDYFARHAVANDASGISRAYVARRQESDDSALPLVLGYFTLSMAAVESTELSRVIDAPLPRYPIPVALIGRLAVDKRAQGRGFGERLLVDALRRVVDAAHLVGCVGVVVDAKDANAERFYATFGFCALSHVGWPRRMFLPVTTARSALSVID